MCVHYLLTHPNSYLAVVYLKLPKMSLLQGELESRQAIYQRNSSVCKTQERDADNNISEVWLYL